MKFVDNASHAPDDMDFRILAALQEDCRTPLARIGESVGLSPPAVLERIKKLESAGIITGYSAIIDSRRIGLDITAFIGVMISHPAGISDFEERITELTDILECHHVTGAWTLLLKVKTANTSSLEELISRIRSIDGVARTETMVVLSTHTEHVQLPLPPEQTAASATAPGRARRPRLRAAERRTHP